MPVDIEVLLLSLQEDDDHLEDLLSLSEVVQAFVQVVLQGLGNAVQMVLVVTHCLYDVLQQSPPLTYGFDHLHIIIVFVLDPEHVVEGQDLV